MKFKYILKYENGETFDSYEENGDSYDGTFSTYEEAADAALYSISCHHLGGEILNLTGDNDIDYNEDENIEYEIEEIDL